MAKKRKTTKGSSSSKHKDSHKAKEEAPKKATRSSGRSKKKSSRQNAAAVDDYKLRNSVEADGLTIIDMNADGNCLFRALSDQLYNDYGNRHDEVRSEVCTFMEENEDEFKLFLVFEDDEEEEEDAKDFESYISNMRLDGEWGGNLELVAAARLYQRRITVFSATLSALTIDHGDSEPSGPDLLVSFHDNDHYNSVRSNSDVSAKSPSKRKSPKKKSKSNSDSGSKVLEVTAAEPIDATQSTTNGMSELSVDDSKSKASNKANTKPIKKSSPCPCGSGLRYKKCCLAKQKHEVRLEKMKQKSSSKGDCGRENEDSDEDVVMKGNFRVLQI